MQPSQRSRGNVSIFKVYLEEDRRQMRDEMKRRRPEHDRELGNKASREGGTL